jgi:hypothetical protein
MSTKDELLEAFHRFQDALVANDTDTLDRLMAPDYRGFSLRGELEDRDAVLEAWKPGGVCMNEVHYRSLEADIRGEIGILTGRGSVAGTFRGQPWGHDLHFCDLYIRTSQGWRILLSHSVETPPPDGDGGDTDPIPSVLSGGDVP